MIMALANRGTGYYEYYLGLQRRLIRIIARVAAKFVESLSSDVTSNSENGFACCSRVKLLDARRRKGYVYTSARFIVVAGTRRRPALTPLGAFSIPSSRYLPDSPVSSLTRKSPPFSRSRKRRFGLSSLP